MKTFAIVVTYTGIKMTKTLDLPTESEVVLVEAESLQAAASQAMRHNHIDAMGRMVQFFDSNGRQIIVKSH